MKERGGRASQMKRLKDKRYEGGERKETERSDDEDIVGRQEEQRE